MFSLKKELEIAKERCKQIEDNVGSNQALKQVVGRNVG